MTDELIDVISGAEAMKK
ncbi:MAG: hypothetical protein IJ525_04530 [Alphaproteobacteria bacterium]|nr:hypothetical protein [Alphaproteobacteria bacterium]